MPWKTSFSEDIVRVEAEYRTDMYKELLSKELNNVDSLSWHFEVFADIGYVEAQSKHYEEREIIEGKNIFKVMSDKQKRICWIVGEHGIGKSSFAAFVATAWAVKDKQLLDIQDISSVFVLSLAHLEWQNIDNVYQIFFPLTSLVLEKDALEAWLREENVVIIFDDVNKHSEKIITEVLKITKLFPNLIIWFMGRPSSILKFTKNPAFMAEAIVFEFKGLKGERIFALSEELCSGEFDISLKKKLKKNMNRLGTVMKYPAIAYMTFKLWNENSDLFKNIYTASDLMWEILSWQVKQILRINIKKIGPVRKKFLSWLMLAGELALYSIKEDLRLDKQSLEELEIEIVSLYKENGKVLLNSFFKSAITHSFASCFTVTSSTSKPFLEYLSSWFFIDQLLHNIQMSQLTNGLVNQVPLILFSAGHLERFQDEGSITVPEVRKVIKALVTYKENSYEDFDFIQRFVAEMKCIKRLVEIVIDETEYNEEWNINLSGIQHKPLEVLLNHVSPVRLILLTDESKKNYELSDVIKYICRVDISVWLDSIPQFTYGHTRNLDKLLKPFIGDRVASKIDLIAGCLSSSMLKELPNSSATQHLVLLKLKVSSNKNLSDALAVPKYLPHILWLELKIDMNFHEIEVTDIKETRVSLFDVHLRRIKEADVTCVADLLTAMQLRITGIHLEETSLTPEGVFTLLKELCKRGVTLHGDQESIMKFRLWYYPSLSSLPKWKRPTEEECIELIGHDDREFFSDHYVNSSQFVTALDAWNLRNYLETQKNIIHFVYEASNIIFSKELNGQVQISFKGEYKETLEDKVLGSIKNASDKDIENEVLDLC